MVRELAPVGGKIVVALLEGILQVGIGVNLHVGGLSEALQIVPEEFRTLDGHGTVRTPGRDNLHAEGMLGNHLVITKVVGGVVGGAHHLHVEPLDERLSAELRRSQLGVALLEDFTGRGGRQELVYAEHAAQLQVRPVVERVAHGVRNSLGPLLKGLPGRVLAAGEVILAHAVGTHGTPLIVVSVVTVHQPQLGNVTELDVFRNLLRHQVAVIVDDGHVLGMLVV